VQFSIWTDLPPAALVARLVLAAALVLLALSPLVRPPVTDDPRAQAALAAALLIGAQLLLGYWFYSYLTWCYPLLVVAFVWARVRPEEDGPAAPGDASEAALAETTVVA
jgi:hypothetical protein